MNQAPGLYFEVNMGSAQVFDELAMATPNSPTDYAQAYQVQVSADGATWSPVELPTPLLAKMLTW